MPLFDLPLVELEGKRPDGNAMPSPLRLGVVQASHAN
jgi:hypothetical protein